MELKQVHMYIMFAIAYGQLGPGFMDLARHHLQDLQDNGYITPEPSLTDRGQMALDYATKKAGEI